jgi:hypothetical protein
VALVAILLENPPFFIRAYELSMTNVLRFSGSLALSCFYTML